MTICTHDGLARGGQLCQVKSAVKKISFSIGVALPYTPMTVKLGRGVFLVMDRFGVIQKWCSILVWTHKILAGG